MIHAYKTFRYLKNIRFGVEVPRSTRHALQLDKAEGTNSWKKAIDTEINQLHEYNTFKVLGKGEKLPPGCKIIPYHCIYDVKFDGRKKCRLVAGGHMTDPASEEVFSVVVEMKTVRMGFVIAKDNQLKVVAGDVGNAYLNGRTKENVVITSGPVFGPELEGRILINIKYCMNLSQTQLDSINIFQ